MQIRLLCSTVSSKQWYTTALLQWERTFQGIVLITTEACPMETRSGFFVARRGASARKYPVQVGNGTAPRDCSAGQGGTESSKQPFRCHREQVPLSNPL